MKTYKNKDHKHNITFFLMICLIFYIIKKGQTTIKKVFIGIKLYSSYTAQLEKPVFSTLKFCRYSDI